MIVPDLRGYGATSAPESVAAYRMKTLAQDLIDLLDYLKIEQAVFLGHDWGGALVYRVCLYHPTRVVGVGSICTPYFPPMSQYVSLEKIVERNPAFRYQLHFQSDEAATLLEVNPKAFFINLFRERVSPKVLYGQAYRHVTPDSTLISEEEIDYYANTYSKRSFRGPLNWYRTRALDFEDEKDLDPMIRLPVLYIGAELDPVLPPALSKGMETFLPNLTRAPTLKHSGHWALWTEPDTVNAILQNWLQTLQHYRGNSRL